MKKETKKSSPLFAFFGTPRMAVWVLEALEKRGFLPALVVTAPDKPSGRGLALTPPPAKVWARKRGIDVAQPESVRDEGFAAELANTEWDVFVVAAYGKLIPKEVLAIPRHGALNVHPSLLPKFRGPSPVVSAILENERETGVSIMHMDEKMDHGPVVAQARVEIAAEEWPIPASVLTEMLFTEGGNLLAEILPEWLAGRITPEEQDESAATYTKKCTVEDALLRQGFEGQAHESLLKIRAFDKNPRAHFLDKRGKRVIVTDAQLKNGKLEILRVIPEGKKELSFKTYRESLA